jgi:putative transposase
VIRTFRYSLKPTKAQERTLLRWLDLTRELYNAALEERREKWSRLREKTHLFDQIRQLPEIREARPEIADVPTSFLRGALQRIDNAFKDFIGRCRRGDKPGYPRFRGAKRWPTLYMGEVERARVGKLFIGNERPLIRGQKFNLVHGRRIAVPNIGGVKISMHRPIEGRVLVMSISRLRNGWSVSITCEVPAPEPLPKTGNAVGVDLGLLQFAATSDGEIFENPHVLRDAQAGIARAARRMRRRKRGGARWKLAVSMLSKHYARVANLRRENHIKVAKSLVANYDKIVVESLTLKGLSNGPLAKAFRDAAFGNFLHWLHVKAESAGRVVVEVDPWQTSQTCPDCGRVAKKDLKQRTHRCECGLVCDRDVAAARVILKLGTSLQGAAAPVRAQRRSAKVKSKTSAHPT